MTGNTMSAQLLLERLADELARLAASAMRLEGLMLHGNLDAETMVLAQSHDLLSQTIAELEGFVRASSPIFAEGPERDLHPQLAAIRLSALATRLQGWTEAETRSGEVDLF